MKIVFLDEATVTLDGDMDMEPLRRLGDLVSYPNTVSAEAAGRAGDAQVVITNKVTLSREFFAACPSVRYVAVIATGYNNVDMEAAREHGVVVSNVSGYARFAVPQHAFALLLNLAGRVWRYIEDVRRGDWAAQNSFTLLRYPTFELAGKTLGIVGFGSTGRGAARIAEGFGMRVVPHNSSAFEEPPYRNHSFDQLLAESDAITIHCPLTSQTRDLFDAAAFTRMKSSALLVNTARGGIVNEHALLDALKKRTIAGAALDVLSEEPPRDNPLLAAELDNLIVTPHTAWSARAARRRLIEETARNIAAFAEGRRRNVVSESSRRGGHGSSDGGGSSTPQQSS